MKHNYLVYILLIFTILFRSTFLNIINNFTSSLFIKNNNFEVKLLQSEKKYLLNEYDSLINFKNNINIDSDYTITNIIKNSYGFNNLVINGSDYLIGDEVVNAEGLIGIISKTIGNTSEVDYLYNTNLVVKINDEIGKISNHDKEGNLIVTEISNYNNIKINDLVYSVYGTFLGKIIKIKYDVLDNYLTVKTVDLNNLNYVAVISR